MIENTKIFEAYKNCLNVNKVNEAKVITGIEP